MNLVRLGHYHLPNEGDGTCQTALVVGVVGGDVNLKVWTHEGDEFTRMRVSVGLPEKTVAGGAAPAAHASFHLSGDCPWGK